jgi:hypothetical protein
LPIKIITNISIYSYIKEIKIELYKKMKTVSPVDKFGKFIVENLRDKGIDFAAGLLKSHWKATSLLEIQNEIATLNDDQKTAFMKAVT